MFKKQKKLKFKKGKKLDGMKQKYLGEILLGKQKAKVVSQIYSTRW